MTSLLAVPAARRPWRAFAAITIAVVLLHGLVLSAVPATGADEASRPTRSFETRTIVPAPAEVSASTAPPPAEPATARPARRRSSSQDLAPLAAPSQRSEVPSEAAGDTKVADSQPPDALPATPQTAPVPSVAASEPAAATPSAALADAVIPPPSQALAVPASARLQYAVSAIRKQQPIDGGAAEVLWLTDGKRYEASIVAKLLFIRLRSNASVGAIGADGLQPERFSDTLRSEVAAHFEREKGKITFSANTPEVPLIAGAQDRLSLFFQLSALVAGDPSAYPAGTVLAFQTVGPRDAQVWRFGVVGKETLHLPAGEMETLKLQRTPRREWDQTAEVWLAPSLGYLPVRIRLTEANGDMVDQRLRTSGPP